MGGYVAACALRAAGAEADGRRPAAFSCHYMGVARFDTPVDLHVETRKGGRTATSQRVEISQEGRPILDAMVWSVSDVDGLEHDETTPPDVPGPDALPNIEDLLPDDAEPPFPFWRNFEAKPIDFVPDWPPAGPLAPRWREWLRFAPTATFEDEWIDAGRSLILVDLPSWPAAHRPHAWTQPPFTAPTLDLNVAFHRSTREADWLLCDGSAPLSTDGLYGWTARVWSPGGRLHASGGGQCLYRRLPPAPADPA
jgi:acyl-CoA thioesterase-2